MEEKNLRVLVVDDMSMMRVAAKNNLQQMGFRIIHEAANGVRAYTILEEQLEKKQPVDLILADWQMPEMSGLDLLKKVRASESFKNIPFIMVTAEGEASQVKEALEAGVSSYLVKPYSTGKFQEKIQSVIKKHAK